MKLSRIARWAAGAATAALVATSLGVAPASAVTKDTVRYVGSNTPTSLNSSHRQHNLVENAVISYMTGAGFNYYNDKAQLIKDTKFGTYKKISDNPLRVRYTVNPGVQWSDGAPIDAYDVLLSWVVSSGNFDNPANGTLWDSAGKRAGTDKITKFPVISDGGRTVTFTYDEFVSNWEIQIGVGKPVHALTQLAYPSDTDQAAKVRFFKAVRAKDWSTLKKIADQWNTAYNILNTTGVTASTNPNLLISGGGYIVEEAIAIIENWQKQLAGTDIAEELDELKSILADGGDNSEVLSSLLADLGEDTIAMAESDDINEDVAIKIEQLGELLSQMSDSAV